MNISDMQSLIEIQKNMIANQQGQIDALKGVPADKTDPAYLSGYSYQYAAAEQSSAMQQIF